MNKLKKRPFVEFIEAALVRVFREARLAAGWRVCRRSGGKGHVWHVEGMFGSAHYPPAGPIETLAEAPCYSHRRAAER